MAALLFSYLAAVVVVTAVLVVALRNPVHSAISLLVMFFHVAGLYLTLNAEFLAAIQIIVYAGAILVLYLFVLMLLNLKAEDRYQKQWVIGALLGAGLAAELIYLVLKSRFSEGLTALPAADAVGNTKSIGLVLFTQYLFPFEIASLILLVAMIGAIILAKRGLFGGAREESGRPTPRAGQEGAGV